MKIINIPPTDETPHVTLDKDKGLFQISGRSLPEDAAHYYNPILEWLDGYAKAPNPSTDFVVKLEYFNTASSKILLDVFTKLQGVNNCKIKWFYDKGDEDMEEAGKEFAELVEVPFEITGK